MSRTETKTSRSANGSGSIRKITTIGKNGKEYTYWQGRCTVGYDPGIGRQKQRSITGKTQKEVAQKLRQLTAELDAGTYQEATKITLSQWLETWQKEYLFDVKPSTAYLYKQEIALHIVPRIGAVKLKDLDTATIQAMYNDLYRPKDDTRPLSAKSIKNTHGVLHKALQQAVSCNLIRTNPSDGCMLPRVEKTEVKPLDDEQISLFLKAVQGNPYEHLFKITLFTGLRQGGILGLTWACIDFSSGTLTVKQQLRKERQKGGSYYFSSPKNGRTRVVTLAPSVVDLFLQQQSAEQEKELKAGNLWENRNLVFSNEVGGFLSYRVVYKAFKKVVASIGRPDARFHDLRHSYAVAAIRAGDDIKTVQSNLGHATASFTLDTYGHVTDQMKRASASRIEQFIQSVSQ